MIQKSADTYVFYLKRTAYKRIGLLSWLLAIVSLTVACSCALLGARLWPGYSHIFTPYLKWQDALLATLWYVAFILAGGSILVVRFFYALRAGYRQGMFIVDGDTSLTVRDLSPKNLGSIYWVVGTAFSCFIAALVGLVPEILIGWTVHLPHPALVFLCTAAAIILSLAGLVVTVIASSFIVIGFIGSISFCRKMGAPQTYQLSSQTTIRIDGLVLTIINPDQQESMFDLNLLDVDDQRRLLFLLRKRWLEAERPWNPRLGEEIEAALEEATGFTVLV
jgi:hypothetical protein